MRMFWYGRLNVRVYSPMRGDITVIRYFFRLQKQFIRLLTKKAKWHSIWSHYHKADRHNNAIFGREGSTWVPFIAAFDP